VLIIHDSRSAIGHSTNLIGRDANIVIIRGGNEGTTIYHQMLRAVEEYFPESNITSDPEVDSEALGARDEENAPPQGTQTYPLRRVSTGTTSLVGSMNGQRPGGYILVIDGLALEDVSFFFPVSAAHSSYFTGLMRDGSL